MTSNGSNEIKNIKIADPEEIMLRYKKTGDLELKNQLVMHYIKHVNAAIYSMRATYFSNIPYEDFFDEGVIALMDCIERYEPCRGASFDTYSYLAIRGSILKYIRKQNWRPNRVWSARKNIMQAETELEQKLMRTPNEDELAEYLNISVDKFRTLINEVSAIDVASFEELVENTYNNAMTNAGLISNVEVSEKLIKEEMLDALAEVIEELKPRQKQVISLYYYENLNLREIGEVLGITQQRVSQIRSKALEIMSKKMNEFKYNN